jgi:hypothetical protein
MNLQSQYRFGGKDKTAAHYCRVSSDVIVISRPRFAWRLDMSNEAFKLRRLRLEEFNQLWVVEYSVSQRAFSVRTVSEMLEYNRSNVLEEVPVDYLPIGFTYTRADAETVVGKLRENIDQQAYRRAKYEAITAKSEADRLQLMEHCDDRLWAHFRTSIDS